MGEVRVEILSELPRQRLAREIFDLVWPVDEGTQITPNLLQAMVHSGAYLSGAFIGDDCVGAAFAFPSKGSDDHLHLHSHMAGVLDAYRDRNIGYVLKVHQRDWAIANGYDLITWTFDPLVSRNANFNLTKLGVEIPYYFRDFYGQMPDAVNAGDASDRAMAYWHLNSARTKSALTGAANAKSDAPLLLAEIHGAPVAQVVTSEAKEVRVALPGNITELRSQNIELARNWRQHVRGALEPRMASGWKITGFTQDHCYVLEEKDAHS
ncbi:MAG: hypothetical protein CK545_02740 [Actinobacteria bacterium]|nr:MAG: hypothetical protein CK545_02740 [Actinomycetota bacterium]